MGPRGRGARERLALTPAVPAPPPLLDFATTIRRITGCCPEAAAVEWHPADAAAMRSLPRRVVSVGLAADGEGYWLWLEPAPGAPPESPGQFVLDVPAGRYVVEVFDSEAHCWFSRESAAGGPLVAGVPCRPAALVVRIRPAPAAP
jgi:hypothetical protein